MSPTLFAILLFCAVLHLGCHSTPKPPEDAAARQAREARTEADRIERARRAEANRQLPEGWLHGTLTANDGTVLPFRIEKKRAWGGSATGGVAAKHPNGEVFRGTYTGILPSAHGRSYVRLPNGQSAWVNTTAHSNTANAIATLTGDKGTFIQLSLTILAGFTPHGIGGGEDNKGNSYQVQF